MKFQFTKQNDWRIQQLKNRNLTTDVLEKILDEVTVIQTAKNIKIQILIPGLSGFHVLLVSYSIGTKEYNFVLKIGLFKDEKEAKNEIKKQEEANACLMNFDNKIFINCGFKNHIHIGKNHWIFFGFVFVKGKDTFKDFFSSYILKPDFNIDSAKNIIENVFNEYETGKWSRKIIETYIWSSGKHSSYKPIEQKEYYSSYLENIHNVLSRRPDLAKGLEISNVNIKNLCNFLENNIYRTMRIDTNLEKIPVGYVHGDLNSGNILLNKNDGNESVFIDFIQMPENDKRHILYDIGKLSVDFERFILPSKLFDDKLIDKMRLWVDIHNDWIRKIDLKKYEKQNYIFYRLYEQQSVIRNCSNKIINNKFDNIVNSDRHFLIIRLHFILRIINHHYLEDYRKLFAIKAAIDLLDLLIGEPRKKLIGKVNSAGLYFDCTKEEFINHLVASDRVYIIGITNESLGECLKKAHTRRSAKKAGQWKELKVLFPSKQLLDVLINKHRIDSPDDIKDRWEQGLGAVRSLLNNSDTKYAEIQDIRRSDKILPFVGQMYNGYHIRVAYLLPNFDLKKSCYLNYSIHDPPCMFLHSSSFSTNNLEKNRRQCKNTSLNDPNCKSCDWVDRASCKQIEEIFSQILTESTPLFTANIYGIYDGEKFRFRELIPQYKWRNHKVTDCEKIPTHLFIFIILFYEGKIVLQYRTHENASGDINEYAVIPGKVNDEDFFEKEPPNKYRKLVHELQTTDTDTKIGRKKFEKNQEELTSEFSKLNNITIGKEIPKNKLENAFVNAASRTVFEKLGISVQKNELNPDNKESFLVEKNDEDTNYNLYIKLFGLDINVHQFRNIKKNRPHAELKQISLDDFEKYKDKGKLSIFLSDNYDKIKTYACETINSCETQSSKVILVSKCLLGKPCQFDNTAADRQLESAWIKLFGLDVIEVCPEELGGLRTPRKGAEIIDGDGYDVLSGNAKVKTYDGTDLTEEFKKGANEVLRIAKENKISKIIGRRRSPSCSCKQIFNGQFSKKLKSGVGVTIALLKSNTNIEIIEFEEYIINLFECLIDELIDIYNLPINWKEKLDKSKALLAQKLPIKRTKEWEEILVGKFKEKIPVINETKKSNDSDTIRFFQELFKDTYNFEIINNKNRCKICTLPEGFLDTYINNNGICSACSLYINVKDKFENKDFLQKKLENKINEIKGKFKYDAIAAFSGGKDSTYMTLKLKKEYNLNLLCAMDDLNQQNELALKNINKVISKLNIDLEIIAPPKEEKNIRRNFLLAGNHFCRLCLRAHFIRIYELAIKKKIPLIFYGLSPYQCLDCVDAINHSLNSIEEVSTPYNKLDFETIIKRYKNRAFQGGFEIGFVSPKEKELLQNWSKIYNWGSDSFAPLIIPFFLFTEYPKEEEIIKTISEETEWEKPEIILNRTNCRMLKLAGIVHKAIGRYHFNYKERATALRFKGDILSTDNISLKVMEMESPNKKETMTLNEFTHFLNDEFNLTIEDLPDFVKNHLKQILVSEIDNNKRL